MPTVTFNGQCFAIDQRRIFLFGAAMPYARVPESEWNDRLAAIRQAGCNIVQTNCPWLMHEPRQGRFDFEGQADVRRFIELCAEHDLYVMLQPGPFIGDAFDGGGLPHWLTADNDLQLRDGDSAFLEHVGPYLRKLLGDLSDLQVTNDGPILLVQAEHAWTCGNEVAAAGYLGRIVHIMQECGYAVPIVAANDLWVSANSFGATLDAWRGGSDLLAHLRQLRGVQPNAPRIVSSVEVAPRAAWGDDRRRAPDADDVLRRVTEVVAAGGQPIIQPFHAGVAHGWLAGRFDGAPDRFSTTAAAVGAPLGEAGTRTDTFHALQRLGTFVTSFANVFADLDPDRQPVIPDLTPGQRRKGGDPPIVVPLTGDQGQVIFVYSASQRDGLTLLLDDGRRLPIEPGDVPVSWYVVDVDLQGNGRLDYANVSPWAMVGRRTLVLFGKAKSTVLLAINGRPLEAQIPSGQKPTVISHENINLVLLNHAQLDATCIHGDDVYVGVSKITADGEPVEHPKFKTVTMISPDGETSRVSDAIVGKGRSTTRALRDVRVCTAAAFVNGTSPRYASLAGPSSLVECGASTGYGWYRIVMKKSSDKKRRMLLPGASDRVHIYNNDACAAVIGEGPGARRGTFDLKLAKDDAALTLLVDNLGRFSDGNDLDDAKGIHDHLVEVADFKVGKVAKVTGEAMDPFVLRGFISGLTPSVLSDTTHFTWTINHLKKSVIYCLIDGLDARGTFLLNGEPMLYYAGTTGATTRHIRLDPADDLFKRGKNEWRFVPDARQDISTSTLAKTINFVEAVDVVSADATWSFAKWDAPPAVDFEPIESVNDAPPCPTWFSGQFSTPGGPWPSFLDTNGLSKGCAIVNGRSIGRYFTARENGKAVGPQTRLWIPDGWMREGEDNELLIFDEHGFNPSQVRVVTREHGDLDV
ncbi:MAG: beta-galactosidase [Planctomycetota bacterium]